MSENQKRITGIFTKQTWGGRKGNDALFFGEEEFDATEAVLKLPHEELIALQDNDVNTDVIGINIVGWEGPCEVCIVDSVIAFFGVGSIEDVTPEMLEQARNDFLGQKPDHQPDEVFRAIKELDILHNELFFESDLVGYGIQAAGQMLCDNWKKALNDGVQHNLVEDVDSLIHRLEIFRVKARRVLPIANGGFGGISESLLLEKLNNFGVEIYESDGGTWGFTGCDVDEFVSSDEAMNAALQAHPEVISALKVV